MNLKFFIVFLFMVNLAGAQDFEGTITWSIRMDITDPKLKAQMKEAEKQMKDPAMQAQMKQAMEKMNDPQVKKMMESNPQLKAQMETMMKNMQSGDMNSMMPTGVILKSKGGNTRSSIEGGIMSGMETLYLKDKDESYLINREAKTYSVVPKHESQASGHEPTVTVKKTTDTQKILNYTCTKTLVTVTDGTHTINQVFWTTTELKGIDFNHMSNQRIGKSKEAMYYKDLDGVPLKMEMRMPQGNMTMEVTDIRKQSLPVSDFQIPAGFTQTPMMGQ